MLFYGIQKGIGEIQTAAFAFLVYNMIAFGLQPIIGYYYDQNSGIPVGIIGCTITAAGMLLLPFCWLSLTLCALGNALFHIGGGADSLRSPKGRISRSGVFVSTGALGVALGTLYGKSAHASIALPFALLCVSAALLALMARVPEHLPRRTLFRIASGRPFAAVLILALCSVAIRSFVGFTLPFGWKSGSVFLSLLPALAAFGGKAAGGFLADALGSRCVGVAALALSAPLLMIGQGSPAAAAIGLMLFNCTMAVTLCVLASVLPEHTGLAFGLSTLALLGGNMPTFFFQLPQDAASFAIPVLIAVSAVCVFLSTRNQKGASINDKDAVSQQLPV